MHFLILPMRKTVKWRCFPGQVHHARPHSSGYNVGGFSSGELCIFVCPGDMIDEYLAILESLIERLIFLAL